MYGLIVADLQMGPNWNVGSVSTKAESIIDLDIKEA